MPRPWIEVVQPLPDLDEHKAYACQVVAVEKNGGAINAHLKQIEEPHGGRTHTATLPLPVRAVGAAAEFLRACGAEVNVGVKIAPRSFVGQVILVRFARGATNQEYTPVSFAPGPSERNNG